MKKQTIVKKTPAVGFSTIPSQVGQYIHPKGWEEITADEKVERMREIIKSQFQTIERLSQDIQFLRDILFKHSHGENNKIMVEASQYRNNIGLGGGTTAKDNNSLASVKPFF